MIVINDKDILGVVEESLQEARASTFEMHIHPCRHCGCPLQYPLIVRQQDIDNFQILMRAAAKCMNRHNITANILADIVTESSLEIARRNSRKNPPTGDPNGQ